MKRMWCCACVFVLGSVGLVVGGDAKKDAAKLQGTWTVKKGEKTGTVKFKGNKFTVSFDEKEVHEGTFKLNPDANPKEIDMMVTESPKYKDKTSLGIYDVDGDTFKWCANEPGKKERPGEFSDKYLLLELKRVKK